MKLNWKCEKKYWLGRVEESIHNYNFLFGQNEKIYQSWVDPDSDSVHIHVKGKSNPIKIIIYFILLDKLCFDKNLIPYILNAFCYHSSFFLLCFLLIGLMKIIVFDWKKSDQLDFNIVNLIIYHMCSCFFKSMLLFELNVVGYCCAK